MAINRNTEDLDFLKKELEIHKKNLGRLKLQKAEHGSIHVPLHILNQIEDEENEIKRLEKEIEEPEGKEKIIKNDKKVDVSHEAEVSIKTGDISGSNVVIAGGDIHYHEAKGALVEKEDKRMEQRRNITEAGVVIADKEKNHVFGSGFIIGNEGIIVTNDHVVKEAIKVLGKVPVELSSGEEPLEAKILACDGKKDLAIIKIESTNLITLPLGDSNKVKARDKVHTLSSPRGYKNITTEGSIGKDGTITIQGEEHLHFDASISPGSSGGALLNSDEEVIGIIRMGFMDSLVPQEKLHFAIPVNDLKSLLQREKIKFDVLPPTPEKKPDAFKNPFIKGPMITEPMDFFGREKEIKTIFTLLQSMSSCSVVGNRRIGKSSLLYYITLICRKNLGEDYKIAYVDLQSAQCHTLTGLITAVGEKLFSPTILRQINSGKNILVDFEKNIKELQRTGVRPVICLDEFENLTRKTNEFTDDFFESWRHLGQNGLAFITASQLLLRQLCDDGKLTSPFYNILPPLELGVFSDEEAWEFVNKDRPEIKFTQEEKKAIIQMAKGHPLKLQIAAWYITQARVEGEFDLQAVLQKAEKEMDNMIR